MKTLLGLIFCAMVIHFGTLPTPAEGVAYDSAIKPYVAFLKEQKQTAVEYVLSLFDRYDIVVLCERVHPEITQYDLIYDVVSTPQFFQREVGNVFTEVGTVALRPYVESFLTAAQLSDEQVNKNLRHIAENIGWIGIWEATNFYEFLKRVYSLNGSLPPGRRVHVYPSDIEFDWKEVTKESWGTFTKEKLPHRDQILAENVITGINEAWNSGKRAKALVIMNYRHAFPHMKREGGRILENTSGFLMTVFPGRVANVMINAPAPLSGSNDHQWHVTAIQEGKWDAAFAVLGNPNLGFDFNGSPFGKDGFDYFPFIPTQLRYQDVFTGFVFFKPIKDQRMSSGLPKGVFDRSVADELLRRFPIMGTYPQFVHLTNMTSGQIEVMLGTVHLSDYEAAFGKSDYAARIEQWLTAQHPRR